ncbi:MAG: leucyl aminopeptidase, partial [Magnetospirillum sp.]
MKIAFAKPSLPTEGAIAVAVLEGKVLSASARKLDDEADGAISRAIATSRFEGKKGQTLMILAPHGLGVSRVLLIGLGKAKEIDAQGAQAFGGTAVAQLLTSGETEVVVAVDAVDGSALVTAEFAAQAGFGARLRSYTFDKYMTKQKKEGL